MASDGNDKHPHLWISKDHIEESSISPTGGGVSVKRDDYSSHGRALFEDYNLMTKTLATSEDLEITDQAVFKITTAENTKAKNFANKLSKIGLDVIEYDRQNDDVAYVATPPENLDNISNRINAYASTKRNTGKSYLSPIESFDPIPIEEKMDRSMLDENEDILTDAYITLYNIISDKKKTAISRNIIDRLISFGIERFEAHQFPSGTFVIETRAPLKVLRIIGEKYISIRSVSTNNAIVVSRSVAAHPFPPTLQRDPVASDAVVAVVDTGVESSIPAMSGLVTNQIKFLPSGTSNILPDHGTFVASRVIYGDDLATMVASNRLKPQCRVIDVPVFGLTSSGDHVGLREVGLAKALHDLIPNLPSDVRVINLSLGIPLPISNGQFSLLATECDSIQKEHDVMFVIASGNIEDPGIMTHPMHFTEDYSRIQAPAESLLALTVGSLARSGNSSSLSESNTISPFSSIGPGADQGLKPELIAPGGNLHFSANGSGVVTSPQTAVYGLSHTGSTLAYGIGTSYAAPIVSQYAARLCSLYRGRSLNLIKALLIHSAESRNYPDGTGIGHNDFCGFGEPSFDSAEGTESRSVAYILEDKITINNYKYINFYVPSLFTGTTGVSKLKVKVTMVYDPPVNSGNMTQYSTVRISANLFKRIIATNPLDPDDYKQVSGSGIFDYYREWSPIMRFEKEFSRNYRPGWWQVRLRMWSRGGMPDDYEQSFALIVEVEDVNNKSEVFNWVMNEVGNDYGSSANPLAA